MEKLTIEEMSERLAYICWQPQNYHIHTDIFAAQLFIERHVLKSKVNSYNRKEIKEAIFS